MKSIEPNVAKLCSTLRRSRTVIANVVDDLSVVGKTAWGHKTDLAS